MKKGIFFFLLICAGSLPGVEKPSLLSIGSGINDILREKHRIAMVRIEYKPKNEYATIRPLVGVSETWRGGIYVYGGFFFDWILWKHLIFSPNFAAGIYAKQNDKDLGFPLEFRSGIEGGWRFFNEVRISFHFFHISNASLGSKNPGNEGLVFSISVPIGRD